MLEVKYVYWSKPDRKFYHLKQQVPYYRGKRFGLVFKGKENARMCKTLDMIIDDRKRKSDVDNLLRGK